VNSKRIKIKKIKLKQLDEFARRSTSESAFRDAAPISLIRAESQVKNPCGEPDDIALLLAFRDDLCIGYHGLLPGVLNNEAQQSKIYWLVTFYLDPAFRGKGYGKLLVAEILNFGVDLVTTGITQGAEAVYRKAGFRVLGELTYFQLRSGHPDQDTAILQNLESRAKTFKAKAVYQLSEKFSSAGTRQNAAIYFQRNLKTINWMIANPWVVSGSDAREDVEHYHFSRVRDLFKFIALEIYTPDGLIPKGYVVLSVSRKKNKSVVKILDFYFENSEDTFIAGDLALKYAANYRIYRLEYPTALELFFSGQPALKKDIKRKKRLYLYHPRSHDSPLGKLASKIELNYCDSDTAFT
jgi:GNAT superfamily N-acetyltransferase